MRDTLTLIGIIVVYPNGKGRLIISSFLTTPLERGTFPPFTWPGIRLSWRYPDADNAYDPAPNFPRQCNGVKRKAAVVVCRQGRAIGIARLMSSFKFFGISAGNPE